MKIDFDNTETVIKVRETLLKVGISVNDIWDLVNTKESYPEAIPVLTNLLRTEILDDRSKEGIVRALAVKEAKGKIGKVLIDEFHKTPKEKKATLGWAIGNTFEVIVTRDDLEGVLEIVKNKENGMAREMFVLALGKIKCEQSEDVLIDLLDDDGVVRHALSALGKLKSLKAKGKISQLLYHPSSVVRKKAQAILNKL